MDASGFRLYFTPLAGALFTVPSRYCALSVTTSRLSWTVVRPASHGISRVPWYSRWVSQPSHRRVPDCHRLWWTIPGPSTQVRSTAARDAPLATRLTTPIAQRVHAWHATGLDCSPVRSPLLRAEYYFLQLLRCFSSLRSLPRNVGHTPNVCGVAPFGDGRLDAWLPLPYPFAADRRPSSARRAKASSDRAFCLAWSQVFLGSTCARMCARQSARSHDM